jgi:hypothetical protein
MKKVIVLFVAFAAIAVNAQSTNAPTRSEQTIESEATRRANASQPATRVFKPNEIAVGRLTLDGIVVEAIKTRRPLQLVNPAAPPEYGSPEDNVVRDPINGRVGLKFLSIKF